MSSYLWNMWDVKPPPTCRMKSVLNRKGIKNLKDIVFNIFKTLRNLNQLNLEAAFLSRMLYKTKRTFRHDKGLRNLVKIYQCLKRYLKLNMLETVDNFNKNIPGVLPHEATHTYLPTKQMLQWVMFRLQAFAKLFARIIELAEMAGPYLYGKLCLGWAVGSTLCFYALNSRLLVFSKFLVLKSIEWYDALYKCLPILESTTEFLDGYQFPKDLKKWLGDVNFMPPRKKSTIDDIFELVTSTEKDDADDDGDDIAIIRSAMMEPFRKLKTVTFDKFEEDVTIVEAPNEPPKSGSTTFQDVGVPVAKRPKQDVRRDDWRKAKCRKNPYAKPFRKH